MNASRTVWLPFCLASVLAVACGPVPSLADSSVIVVKGLPDSLFVSKGLVQEASNLQQIVSDAADSSVILIEGHLWLKPQTYKEESCGNCEDPNTEVVATVGLIVSGKAKRIVGSSPGESFIHTNSGYGILFEDCEDCAIEKLTITDGIRDPDPNATDAAIVVKRSSVYIGSNRIVDNIGDSAVVRRTTVGIMGVTGRERSAMDIVWNEIIGNSWDGIALYRDTEAKIEQNVIDGIDLARGENVGGGRGVGIGLTWNSRAAVKGNLVRRYWKGIGIFVDASAVVVENVVEDIATWGISLWDADKGAPSAAILGNVIFRTGACGAAIIRGAERGGESGLFARNVLVLTGQNPEYDSGEPYCFQQALAIHKVAPDFQIDSNLFYANREPGDKGGTRDIPKDKFLEEIFRIEARLRGSQLLHRSEFLKWLDSLRKD